MLGSDGLRALVESSGRSLGDLAKEAGVDRSNLAKFMKGEGGMTLDKGLALAGALGLELQVAGKPLIEVLASDEDGRTPAQQDNLPVAVKAKRPTVQANLDARAKHQAKRVPLAGPTPTEALRPLSPNQKRLRKKLGFNDGSE